MPKRKIRKKSQKFNLTLPLTVFVLVLIYSIYFFYYRKDISPTHDQKAVLAAKSSAVDGDETFVAGEVIVKLKQPINEFSKKTVTGPDSKAAVMEYAGLDKTKLPKSINDLSKKHHLKRVEKVFPQAQSPEAEIQKMKKQLNESSNARSSSFKEDDVKKNDLSRIYKFKIDDNAIIKDVINELKKDPNVEYAEPNYLVSPTLIPNDPYFSTTTTAINQWYLNNPGNRTGYVKGADIKALDSWNISRGSTSIVVAVLDSGIYYKHPDLGAGIGPGYKVIGGYDFVNNDADPIDDNGHGTHIAGIIAANINNSKGIAGVCPNCKLMSIKVLDKYGYGSISRGANGIYYAKDHGAKVINISWGNQVYSETLFAAINAAQQSGVIVVAAAGNNGSSTKFYPAAYTNVVGVASTDPNDKKRGSSNFDDGSKWVNISAPGTDILSTSLSGTGGLCKSGNTSQYAYCSGTSMAAPIVAGALALYESLYPVSTSAQVVALRTRIGSATYADNINAVNPSYVNKLGAGRLNMWKFLTTGTTWCADSEWGINPSTLGYVTPSTSRAAKYYDSCDNISAPIGFSGVGEVYCTHPTSSKIALTARECDRGQACVNGACIYR